MGATASKYDWKPDLPDFRDKTFKYPKKADELPESADLREKFAEDVEDLGSNIANSIEQVLKFYREEYEYTKPENPYNFRDAIKGFKLVKKDDEETKENKIRYQKFNNLKSQVKQSLCEGIPIIFGLTVYQSFESDDVNSTGIIVKPQDNEKPLGGISMVIVGYDNDKYHWIMRDPSGKEYYLPYEYLMKKENLCSDFWRIVIE